MKTTILVMTMAAAVILPCCSDLISVNSFVSEKEAVVDTNLLGAWAGEQGDLYVIRASDGEYSIVYSSEKGEGLKFRGRLIKAGEAEFIDLITTESAGFQIPVHCIVRVWPEGALLKWAYLDSKWLREQASQQIASQPYDDSTLLTAPTDALRGFLLKFGSDARAYDKTSVLTRVP